MNELEKYVVERLHNLENKVETQKTYIQELEEKLAEVDRMKGQMREYFRLKTYEDKTHYIDHTYRSKSVVEIAEFIGLEMAGGDDV